MQFVPVLDTVARGASHSPSEPPANAGRVFEWQWSPPVPIVVRKEKDTYHIVGTGNTVYL